MISVEQLEADVAKEEAAMQADIERALSQWRELSVRLKALKAKLDDAASRGLDVKALNPRIAELQLPQLKTGVATQRAETLRREAVQARKAGVAELKTALPDFTGALSRLQYKVSSEEGAVTEALERAKAVAQQVATAAKQLEAAGDEPMPIGRVQTKRQQPRVRMQVKIDFGSDNNFYSGFSTNLSDGGVFIATVKLVPIGTAMDLFFKLPTGDGIEAHGVVRWVRDVDDRNPETMPGLGVQFVNLSDAAKGAIEEFVRSREPMFFPD